MTTRHQMEGTAWGRCALPELSLGATKDRTRAALAEWEDPEDHGQNLFSGVQGPELPGSEKVGPGQDGVWGGPGGPEPAPVRKGGSVTGKAPGGPRTRWGPGDPAWCRGVSRVLRQGVGHGTWALLAQ